MNSSIVQAINDKKTLELFYHGYSRTIEPHAYGRDQQGDEILLCYQTSGDCAKDDCSGWKLLKVKEIFSLSLMEQGFDSRPEYNRNDKNLDYIIAQL